MNYQEKMPTMETEDTIISKIIGGHKIIMEKKFGRVDTNKLVYILEYGRKELRITYSVDSNKFITYLDTVKSSNLKEERETTLLYKAAKILMQMKTNETGKNHDYALVTHVKSMALWAVSKGRDIFDWDDIEPMNYRRFLDDDRPELQADINFKKTFHPQV